MSHRSTEGTRPGRAVDTRRFEYIFKDPILVYLGRVAPTHRGSQHRVRPFFRYQRKVFLRVLSGREVIKPAKNVKPPEHSGSTYSCELLFKVGHDQRGRLGLFIQLPHVYDHTIRARLLLRHHKRVNHKSDL